MVMASFISCGIIRLEEDEFAGAARIQGSQGYSGEERAYESSPQHFARKIRTDLFIGE